MAEKKVVHITSAFGSSSSRILKEASTYDELGYETYVFAMEIRDLGSNVNLIKDVVQISSFNCKIDELKALKPEVVILHNVRTILFSRSISRSLPGVTIIYDAHELESETNGKVGKPIKKAITRLVERINIPKVDRMWVVSDSIYDWYSRRYPKTDIRTVFNYPDMHVDNKAVVERKIELLNQGVLNFVYQGKLTSARFTDQIINEFEKLPDNCKLHIYGYGPLEDFVRSKAEQNENITFYGKVLPHELNAAMDDCHVGFSLLKMNCLNHRYAMPNKLFSYINAGVYTLSIKDTDQAFLLEKLGMGMGLSESMKELDQVPLRLDEIRSHFERILESPVSYTWSLNKKNLEL